MTRRRSAANKWLVGCGIGCLALLLVVAVLAGAGFLMLSRTVEGFRDAAHSGTELRETFGPIEAFTPPPLDRMPGERLEVFVMVRERLEEPRRRLEEAFAGFPPPELRDDSGPLRKVLGAFRGLGALIKPMGAYVAARNEVLMEAGMGPGEYLFYYGLVYYSWLGHSPEDLPRLGTRVGDGDDVKVDLFSGKDATFGPHKARRRYRGYTLAMLRNLQEKLAAQSTVTPESPTAADARLALAREIRLFESDPGNVMWREGLPPAWEITLEKFRDLLGPTWSPATNVFEWPPPAEEGSGFSLTLD